MWVIPTPGEERCVWRVRGASVGCCIQTRDEHLQTGDAAVYLWVGVAVGILRLGRRMGVVAVKTGDAVLYSVYVTVVVNVDVTVYASLVLVDRGEGPYGNNRRSHRCWEVLLPYRSGPETRS